KQENSRMEVSWFPACLIRGVFMLARSLGGWVVAAIVPVVPLLGASFAGPAQAAEPAFARSAIDQAAAERGRAALTLKGFLKPWWSAGAFGNAARLWDQPAPDPDKDAAGYTLAFESRYGLHAAPYPNDGLPMGLRRGLGPRGTKTGLQIDCMVCHGGSIG